ncbi:MAG: argininosuccinate lyase [Candidatus Tectomicrobia bacterium]|nr:argininosuccinate lyase [Candidatus Tectomicrobia bacterium]
MAESKLYGTIAAGEFYRKAGARLKEEADESQIAQKVGTPATVLPLLKAYHMFDKVHIVMLAEENLIPQNDAATMLKAIREMEAQGWEKVRLEGGHGLHSGEAYLIEKLGEEIGGRMHLGRSSGDLGSVSARISLRDKLLNVMEAQLKTREAYLKQAEQHLETVLPTYTMWQEAQVGTFAFFLVSWALPLERDFERLKGAYDRANTSSAGAGAHSGSDFPLNRKRTAELLGFDGICQNVRDANMGRDFILDGISALAVMMSNLAAATDYIFLFFSNEFSFIDMADRYCGTSSIMPQKKNPHSLMLVSEIASNIIGGMSSAFSHARNISGSARAALQNYDSAVDALNIWSGIISTLKVNKEIMRQRTLDFWALATDLAGAMVREKGLPWRTAHQITAILVRVAFEEGKKPDDVDSAFVDRAAREYIGRDLSLSNAAIREVLDPLRAVKARTLIGGPAPSEVQRQINGCYAALERDRETLSVMRRRLDEAAERLEGAISAIVG